MAGQGFPEAGDRLVQSSHLFVGRGQHGPEFKTVVTQSVGLLQPVSRDLWFFQRHVALSEESIELTAVESRVFFRPLPSG